jgi:hypothetical protein
MKEIFGAVLLSFLGFAAVFPCQGEVANATGGAAPAASDYDAVQRCLDLVQLKFVECLVSHCSQRFGQFAEPESHSDDVIDYH